ncbi:MAG: hypothetical protein B6240_10860 [Desulfobacteraceae bacterium 4572_87]|nr:MAG: hypothetical protein B6240_10860 [Desulfobacteraceae bacterium 4572_87]
MKCVNPGNIHNGRHGFLDIQFIAVLSFGFHNKISKKPQRGFKTEGVDGKIPEESCPALQGLKQKQP